MSDKNPLISVIVPVYNVGSFLIPCLDSLKEQAYQNLEILLIDDGSTDSSNKVCDTYAEKDSRFKVFHKENGGVSSARNLGLDIAQGEYTAFVDAADRVLPDYFEVLHRDLTEQNADAAFCNYILVDENGTQLPQEAARFSETKRIEGLETLLVSTGSFGVVWSGLFSASCLHGLRFPNLPRGEDNIFMFDWLCTNPVVSVNTYCGYLYLQRQTSAIHTQETPQTARAFDRMYVHAHRYLNLPIKMQELQKRFLNRYAQAVHNAAYASTLSDNRLANREALLKHINNIRPNLHMLSGKLRFYILLYAKAPRLYGALIRLKNTL